MDKVVHFEIPADDMSRATEFYRAIFGWDLQDMSGQGMDYTIAMTVPVDEQQLPTERGAINGGMMKRSADTPSPVVTIEVASIDDAMKRIGGKRRHDGAAAPGDPGDGSLRLLQGQRGQHDGTLGNGSCGGMVMELQVQGREGAEQLGILRRPARGDRRPDVDRVRLEPGTEPGDPHYHANHTGRVLRARGRARVLIDGRTIRATTGTLVVAPRGAVHAFPGRDRLATRGS